MPTRVRDERRKRGKHFIVEWRRFRKLTQRQLADRLDTTPATISRIEAGKLPYTQDVLESVAEVLGTTPGTLLTRKPAEFDK